MTASERLAFEAGYKAAAPRGYTEAHLDGCLEIDRRHYEAVGFAMFLNDVRSGKFLFGPGPTR